jgi:hypothetical protein
VAIHLELAKQQGTKEYRDCVDALCSPPVIRDSWLIRDREAFVV